MLPWLSFKVGNSQFIILDSESGCRSISTMQEIQQYITQFQEKAVVSSIAERSSKILVCNNGIIETWEVEAFSWMVLWCFSPITAFFFHLLPVTNLSSHISQNKWRPSCGTVPPKWRQLKLGSRLLSSDTWLQGDSQSHRNTYSSIFSRSVTTNISFSTAPSPVHFHLWSAHSV